MTAAWGLAALLAWGVLALWVRDAWATASVQLGILACTTLWVWTNAARRNPVVFAPWLLPLALIPVWGAAQLFFGWTAMPWHTSAKTLEWTVHAAAVFLMLQTRQRRRLLDALLLFSTLVATQALLQLFTSGGKVFWLFDSGYDSMVLGPFVYHNKYAQFVELVFPLALWRAIEQRARAPLYLVAAAIMAAGVIAGASRSGVAFLLIEVVLVLLLAWRRGALTGAGAAWLGAKTGVLIALWGYLAGWTTLWERLTGIDPLADIRWPILQSTLDMIRAHPWTGVGLGAWPQVYPEFARFDIGRYVNQAHCDWLQWLAEGGWPMLVLLIACVALLLPALLRSVWGAGFLVVLLHAAIDYPFQQAPALATLFLCVATLAWRDGRDQETSLTPGAARPHSSTHMRVAALLALLSLTAAAQSRPPASGGPMADAGVANLPGLRIGADDLVAVSVYDAPELTRTVRVSSEGFLRLPMIKQRIRAHGLLPSELENAIAAALVKEGILVDPVVMVTVAEYASRPVSVVGAVKKPVTFQAVGRVTLLDAIARAEGLSDLAGPELLLTHNVMENGQDRRLTRRILVRDLLDGGDPKSNLLLEGGEEIRVPEARKIFVTGNVKRPGAFPVKEDNQLTVMKALALAEGLSPFPQKYAYVYRKDEQAGGVREIRVELRKILKRQAVDFALEPEDTLYIPEDGGKRTAATVTERIVGFGVATASGVLIWRR